MEMTKLDNNMSSRKTLEVELAATSEELLRDNEWKWKEKENAENGVDVGKFIIKFKASNKQARSPLRLRRFLSKLSQQDKSKPKPPRPKPSELFKNIPVDEDEKYTSVATTNKNAPKESAHQTCSDSNNKRNWCESTFVHMLDNLIGCVSECLDCGDDKVAACPGPKKDINGTIRSQTNGETGGEVTQNAIMSWDGDVDTIVDAIGYLIHGEPSVCTDESSGDSDQSSRHW